jgi:hypothetical protein
MKISDSDNDCDDALHKIKIFAVRTTSNYRALKVSSKSKEVRDTYIL